MIQRIGFIRLSNSEEVHCKDTMRCSITNKYDETNNYLSSQHAWLLRLRKVSLGVVGLGEGDLAEAVFPTGISIHKLV